MDSHVRAWEPLLDRFIFQAVMQKVKLVQGFSYLAEWENNVQVYHGGLSRRRILSALHRLTYRKGKAVPLQAWSGPKGSRKLRFPDFLSTAQDVGKVVSLTHRPPLSQEIHLVLISVRGWVDLRAIVRPKGLCHWKIPMTPSGIEPATIRFVAYCSRRDVCIWK